MTPQAAPCAACGAALAGPYCSRCGQRVRPGRLTLRRVGIDALRQVTSLDRGLWRTLADLARRPAGVAADYWRGATAPYVPPVRFFLVAVTAVQVAVFALGLAPGFAESFAEGLNEGRTAGADVVDAQTVADRMQRFWVVGLAGLVPFAVLWSRILFRRGGRTLAEHAVAHLYFLGAFVLALGISVVGGHVIYDHVHETAGDVFSAVTLLGALGLYVWSVARTFGRGRWTGVAGALGVLLLTLAVYMAVWGFAAGVQSAHGA